MIKQFQGDSGRTHAANFIAALRSRKREELRAEILQGHLSTAFCHLANISHLAGRHRPLADIAAAVEDQPLLGESFERLTAHLQANEIDLARTPLTLGARLTFDPRREQFTGEGGDSANAFLTRTYRPPFVVPELAGADWPSPPPGGPKNNPQSTSLGKANCQNGWTPEGV